MIVGDSKSIYSSKWITAEISDGSSRLHFVPIKHTIGDYFVAQINKQLYAFRIDGSRIKTYRQTLVKSFRVLQYDTTHYLPISPESEDLKLILEKNALPKMNVLLFNILKILGRREKAKFEPHKLEALIKEFSDQEDQYGEQVRNIKNYLDNLKIDEVVTPLRKMTDYIEGDLLATDPQFLGTTISSYQRTDVEHKKVTNYPVGAKAAWIKWIAIIALVGLIAAIVYIAYDQGAFDSFTNMFGSFQIGSGSSPFNLPSNQPTATDWMSQYTPESLKAAIDRGDVNYDSLPPDVKKLVDGVKLPTATPKN